MTRRRRNEEDFEKETQEGIEGKYALVFGVGALAVTGIGLAMIFGFRHKK